MEHKEFTDLCLNLGPKIYRLALRYLNDSDDAADAVQEVYLRMWNSREQHLKKPEAMAMTITRNYCLDRLKLHFHKYKLQGAEIDRLNVTANEYSHEKADIVKHIRTLIKELPENQKSILHMRDIEGYSTSETAAIMEMNENTIRVNLSRARQKIRELLEKRYAYVNEY
ncbi:MAG: RNA polymerase sigma factor [Bacteroidales bacterium]|nr:RNA polymerase sigma factor [Bacteroidales bacterium]